MLDSLFKICNNTKAIKVDAIVINLFFNDEVRQFVLDLNRINQLFYRGVDADNKGIGEYSEWTEFINEGKSFTYGGESKPKIAGDNYTLYYTGEFYRSFDVIVYKDGFSIEANTIKGKTDLSKKYGKQILGLTESSKDELIDKILPIVINDIYKQLMQ